MKTTSNLSVDMAKFKVYDAYKSGLISEEDANKFLTFINKGEFELKELWKWGNRQYLLMHKSLYNDVLEQNLVDGLKYSREHVYTHFNDDDKNIIMVSLLYANDYIKQTTSKAYRLADITGLDYDWNTLFEKTAIKILPKKEFVPELKPALAKYLEKDGEQYAELRQALIKGSIEQE